MHVIISIVHRIEIIVDISPGKERLERLIVLYQCKVEFFTNVRLCCMVLEATGCRLL